MPNDLAKKYFNILWPIELYKFTSFLFSLVLWPIFYYTEPNFFNHAHFVTAFLLGNTYFYLNTYNYSHFVKEGPYFAFYLLFQFVSIIGISYAHNTNDFIYHAFLPILMAMYYFAVVKGSRESFKEKKSLFVYGLGFCALLIFESFKKGEYFSFNEVVALGGFCFWAFSTTYWGFELYFKGHKNLVTKAVSGGVGNDKIISSKFDRMFFHDMINHTHALLLFLNSKSCSKGLDSVEVNNLKNEIALLQSSMQTHFGFKHKNVKSDNMITSFQLAMARVYSLLDSYFPDGQNITIGLKGKLEDSEDFEALRSCLVDIIAFHRIMTNILKNAFESGASEIECIFDYQDDGLHVTIKNDINSLSRDNLSASELGNVILMDDKKSEGIGLESVGQICNDSGGHFEFSIENGKWQSHFYLPRPNTQEYHGHLKAS